jgi:hypothetical protein
MDGGQLDGTVLRVQVSWMDPACLLS